MSSHFNETVQKWIGCTADDLKVVTAYLNAKWKEQKREEKLPGAVMSAVVKNELDYPVEFGLLLKVHRELSLRKCVFCHGKAVTATWNHMTLCKDCSKDTCNYCGVKTKEDSSEKEVICSDCDKQWSSPLPESSRLSSQSSLVAKPSK